MSVPMETILRTLLRHPHRKWAVIIVTALVSVVTLLPAVDEYNAASQRVDELQQRLAQLASEAGRLQELEHQRTRWSAALTQREREVMTDERVGQFRTELVALARDCGCQLRRIRIEEPRQREWTKDDDPLAVRPPSANAEKTPFVLRSRRLTMTVAGNMAAMTQFLAALSKQNVLIHTTSFTLHKATEGEDLVIMEWEAVMLELARPKGPTSA